MPSLIDSLKSITRRQANRSGRSRRGQQRRALLLETLESRKLLTTAVMNGDWFDTQTWDNGVIPSAESRAIIGHGVTVQLNGSHHAAKEVVVLGNLVVPEDVSQPEKTLTTRWIHVNSGGQFIVGTENNRYDEGNFTLNLTGTDVYADHVIETNMGGMMPGTMNVTDNDGFLMTAMGGRVQFYGEDKLSFTKLAASAVANSNEIIVEKVIERNFTEGVSDGNGFTTSAVDDGEVNWEVGDQIVIASSSYNYTEEDVRTITAIDLNHSDKTAKITLDQPLSHGHYGEIESYSNATENGEATRTYQIDIRAEVALLSRNVKIQGLASQDTDVKFGDRANVITEPRVRAGGLSDAEAAKAPPTQVANGVGGHIMIMPNSGQIEIDGVQLDRMGQASQKGRYPIHWHLGDSRPNDFLKNSSITNSNNRGVTIHGTSDLLVEGVVLHDVHGHGFFFEDAVETGNVLVGNLALGIHTVGGNDKDFSNPAGKDPFVVDTHDSVTESSSRFKSSAAFWITNPTNTFVGNIAAGAGDARIDDWAEKGPSGTGFWYAIPRTVLGASGENSIYDNVIPVYAEFGQFDFNTSHSTAIGLNFDRGEDIEDANFAGELRTNDNENNYSPRTDASDPNTSTTNVIHGFTNYKASDAGVYHRGQAETILFDGLRIADTRSAAWAVSENKYDNSLFVGHSKGNADENALVGGPRLYDGAGLYTNTHFAGFEGDNAHVFQVEGSSFGPTMYHAFQGTSFEDDGTFDKISHAVSDFSRGPKGEYRTNHDLGQPHQWSKAAIDLDGTLTGGVGGGIGYSIVPNVAFLVEDTDVQPTGWDAWLSEDIYTRVKVGNANNGTDLFAASSLREPVLRFTARDGDIIDGTSGQRNGNAAWIQVGAKTDGDGFVEGTFEVEFMKNGLPTTVFDLNTKNQDGNRPSLSPAIQAKVDAARIVVKLVGAANFTPNLGTEVFSDNELRSATSGVVYFRDGEENLYINSGIKDSQPAIKFTPGTPLQTTFEARPVPSRTIEYGTTIQAEQFDNGIDGIAYHDTDATNTLGSFRADAGVDATSTTVGNIADGEWLEYTTGIVGNAYNVGINVSSTSPGGKIRVLAGLNNSAGYLRDFGTVDVPNTQGQVETVWLEGVDLTFAAGNNSVIRIAFEGGDFESVELDSFTFAPATQTSYVAGRTIRSGFATTKIELEEYDVGGQGAAYYDDTPEVIDGQSETFNIAGNDSSDTFRTDEDVDANEGGVGGKVFDGEWLEYTTNVQAGTYDVTLEKIWGGDSNGVKLFIADSNSATTFTQLGEFDFQTGDNNELVTLTNIDLSPWAGSDRVIRIEIIGNWMGLGYLDFVSTSPDQTAPTVDIVDVSPDPRNTNAGVVTINFDEDVTGVDISDLTLTRDGTPVDISGLALTQISPSQYTIDLSSVTEADGIYELSLGSSGSGIQDAVGNALDSNAIDQFMIDMTGPQIESVVVNNGSAQRSMVNSLSVTFSEVVNGVDTNAFILMNTTTNTQVIPSVTTQELNGKTVATFTFSGSGITGGSLADGNYTLTTLASAVTDATGNHFDANGDGTSGDNATDTFFRHFGDFDGDRDVDARDFLQFRRAFQKMAGNSAFNAAFDFDGDGDVDARDFLRFRLRFQKILSS
ncbi:G8 domain protein [Rubripirellula tenax]|uniref:G8 domain protein n=1 Tax=Rubripirellula tenax TaxID=2528015 RepID=A0A5C6FE63_9BACT|nr:G8 domain-containing protein [Rubripirellula tenax]TWU58484.1 G8 domain protein [Rubripirellula tenax]